MKSDSRVRPTAIFLLVLLGLLASPAAFAANCFTICKCRTQCSTPCNDGGDLVTCGVWGICECSSLQTSKVQSAENPLVLAAEPDPLAALLGGSCAALPAPSQAPAVGR